MTAFGAAARGEREKKERGQPRLRRSGFIITLLFVSVSAAQLIKPRRLFFLYFVLLLFFYQPFQSHEKVESAQRKKGEQMALFLSRQGSSPDLLGHSALVSTKPASRLPENVSSSGGKSQLD